MTDTTQHSGVYQRMRSGRMREMSIDEAQQVNARVTVKAMATLLSQEAQDVFSAWMSLWLGGESAAEIARMQAEATPNPVYLHLGQAANMFSADSLRKGVAVLTEWLRIVEEREAAEANEGEDTP